MAQISCGYGHTYDSDFHSVCPVCNQGNHNMVDFTQPGIQTPPPQGQAVGGYNSTMGYDTPNQMSGGAMGAGVVDFGVTRPPLDVPGSISITDDNLTTYTHVIAGDDEEIHPPVVGWLVCIKGVNKGKDYRLSDTVNSIGRDPSMDVTIDDDKKISRENHAVVAYEAKNNAFYLRSSIDKSFVYVNGENAYPQKMLQAYDVIALGDTELLFVPLCNAYFNWTKLDTPAEV